MNDKISIIVPIYNTAEFLEKCLNSLQAQTYKNLEILMIDDGSADTSGMICKKYAAEDERFQYIFQKNAGVSSARNKGLELATGEYIGFCDSDDWIDEDMYETLYALICEKKADVAVVDFIREKGESLNQEKEKNGEIYSFDGYGAILEMMKDGVFAGHLFNKLIRRSLIEDIWLNEKIAIFEDSLFMWDVFFQAKKVVFKNVVKYHYCYHTESAMNHKFQEKDWTGREATYLLFSKMEKHFPNDLVYAQHVVLASSYRLAEKMALSGELTRKNYQILYGDFLKYDNEQVRKFFKTSARWKQAVFKRNRAFFLLYMKGVRIRRALPGYIKKRKASNE